MKVINKLAFHKYQILEKIEAGIVLSGAEIKSIRAGRIDFSRAFARVKNGEVLLANAKIASWMGSGKYVDETRERKLLFHKRQILNWQGKIAGGNLTIVPLAIYIKGNLAKIEMGLAKTKTKFDKRANLKKMAIQRDIERESKIN